MEKKKKPPISIDEAEKKLTEHRQGSLSYVLGQDRPNGGNGQTGQVAGTTQQIASRGKGLGGLLHSPMIKTFVLPLVASMVFTVFMVNQLAMPNSLRNVIATEFEKVAGQIKDITSRMDNQGTRIENVINTMGLYAKKTEIPSSASPADVKVLGDRVGSVERTLKEKASADAFLTLEKNVDARINAIKASVPTVVQPVVLSYWIEGGNPTFRLNVVGDRNGVYIARVTLIYISPVGLAGVDVKEATDYFYNNLNGPGRVYKPEVVRGSVNWGLSSISFITSSFYLNKGQQQTFTLDVTGLGPFNGYNGAMVEVLPSSMSQGNSGGGI